MNSCGRNVLFVAAAVLLLSCQQAYSAAVADSSPLALIQHHAPPPNNTNNNYNSGGQGRRRRIQEEEATMEGSCTSSKLEAGQQQSKGSYLWYVYCLFHLFCFILEGVIYDMTSSPKEKDSQLSRFEIACLDDAILI